MGMEERKPMPKSLLTPGREDLSPWPPVGQLDFERIVGMDEPTLDRAFRERHGLDQIFKLGKRGYPYSRRSEDATARRIEIKRATLARLEGYLTEGQEFKGWYDGVSKNTDDPAGSLKVSLSKYLNDECKKRVYEVNNGLTKEAAVLAPSLQLRRVEREIGNSLKKMKLEPISIQEIVNFDNLPSPRVTVQKNRELASLEKVLNLFFMQIQGLSNSECAARLRVSDDVLEIFKVRYFSPRAKEIIKTVQRK